jgi:hypothetical protein
MVHDLVEGDVGGCGEQPLDGHKPEEAVTVTHGDVDGAVESSPEKRPANVARGL